MVDIHMEILVHFDGAGSQNIWWAGADALRDCALVVVLCAFSDLVITFRGSRKGILALWWSKDEFSWQAQEIGVLYTSSMYTDFIAGAVL